MVGVEGLRVYLRGVHQEEPPKASTSCEPLYMISVQLPPNRHVASFFRMTSLYEEAYSQWSLVQETFIAEKPRMSQIEAV